MVVITYSTFQISYELVKQKYTKSPHKETVNKTCFQLPWGNKEQSSEAAQIRDIEGGPCKALTGFPHVASSFQIKTQKAFPEY